MCCVDVYSYHYTFLEYSNIDMPNVASKTSWPSGLRRDVKAVVFIGVGSNPTDVILLSSYYTVIL